MAGNVLKDGGKQGENRVKRIKGLEISLYLHVKTNASTRAPGGRWEGTFVLRYDKPDCEKAENRAHELGCVNRATLQFGSKRRVQGH